MANTYLTRTFSGAGNTKKWTWSAWVKKSQESSSSTYNQVLFGTAGGSYDTIAFQTTPNTPKFFASISGNFERSTNALHRDCNGWYHLVVTFDSAQGTAADRLKLYVNGVQQSSFADNTNGNQNDDSYINTTDAHQIGKQAGLSRYFDGVMSHVHFCDGYAYAASSFGSTDTTTGEWRINTNPSVSYGTNGFFILKDGNSVTDQSGNSNNFTVAGGTLTKTEDNPSNVFATINPLLGIDVIGGTVTYANGNTVAEDPNGSASGINPNFISTLGMPSSGKWYCEVQPSSFSTSSGHSIGIYRTKGSTDDTGEGDLELNSSKIRYIYADTSIYIIKYGTNDQTGLTSITSGQTVGMALDLDNGTLQYYVNGSARANQITGINSANDGYDYFFHAGLESSSSGRYGKYSWNFGNGAFGSTQLTGTTYNDSQGRGIFKYQPPTNFLALCTKNLNV